MAVEDYPPAAENGTTFAFNRLTLRFADDALEKRFWRESIARSVWIFRAGMMAGVVIYGLFGIIDAQLAPRAVAEVWLLRYGIMCPLLTAIVAFSFTRRFNDLVQPTLGFAMLVAGGGLIAISIFMPPPSNRIYASGLVLIFIFFSTFSWLRWYYSALLSLTLIGAYQLSTLANPIPPWVLVNNNVFLLFSALLTMLSSYAQELRLRQNFATKEQLLERKAHTQELLRQARAASQAKSDFLAVVSHELRTPLNAIIGFSEVLKTELFGPLGSARYRSYVEDIYASGTHLLSIINDILDLSKAEAGKLTLNEEETHLASLLERCLRMCGEKAADEGVRISLVMPGPDLLLLADPRLLSQLVLNLLTNAVKFTPRDGTVTLSVSLPPDGTCEISVRDTGIGIAKEDLGRVLEPFVQVENALSREHGGAGLGLPFAKKIAELHDGKLMLDSEPGQGTVVTVSFPGNRVILADESSPHPPFMVSEAVGQGRG